MVQIGTTKWYAGCCQETQACKGADTRKLVTLTAVKCRHSDLLGNKP